MKHISIRVPWHDNKWNGTICQCPKNNPFCMMLHNISERKDENKEETYAGKDWNSLKQDQLPACVGENGGFMNEKPYKRIFKHVYGYGYHERIYNYKEYVKLLTSVGFVVDVYNISARYNKNGLNPLEDLYICKKK